MLKEEEIRCLDVQDLLSSAFGENQILNGNSIIFYIHVSSLFLYKVCPPKTRSATVGYMFCLG